MLDNFSDDEIETVIAHEMGHYKKKHIIKGIMFSTASSFFTFFIIAKLYETTLHIFGFSSLEQVAAIPLLFLWAMIVGLILTPLGNIFSRKHEYEADEYAIEVTGKPDSFISTLEKLTEQNLGDKTPHPFVEWFFYSHPSISKRINAITNYVTQNVKTAEVHR